MSKMPPRMFFFKKAVVVGFVALLVGIIAGRLVANNANTERLDRVVAMSWGDGKYGKGFYGAHVYLSTEKGQFSVRARVLIGRGNDYYHDCGVLGKVTDASEAVERWGAIDWKEDGLHVGSGTNEFFLPRTKLEQHR